MVQARAFKLAAVSCFCACWSAPPPPTRTLCGIVPPLGGWCYVWPALACVLLCWRCWTRRVRRRPFVMPTCEHSSACVAGGWEGGGCLQGLRSVGALLNQVPREHTLLGVTVCAVACAVGGVLPVFSLTRVRAGVPHCHAPTTPFAPSAVAGLPTGARWAVVGAVGFCDDDRKHPTPFG